jgi:hypothetical protein
VKPFQLPKDFAQLPVFGAGILDIVPVVEVFHECVDSMASLPVCME